MSIPPKQPDDVVRVRLDDGAGHSMEMAVIGAEREIRIETRGPSGVEIRGAFESSSFEHQVEELLRSDNRGATAGRFQVAATQDGDKAGFLDWRAHGPTMRLHPHRGDEWDLPSQEAREGFLAMWEAQRPDA